MPDMTRESMMSRDVTVYGFSGRPIGKFPVLLDDPDPCSNIIYIDVNGRDFPVQSMGNGNYQLTRPRHVRKILHYIGQ